MKKVMIFMAALLFTGCANTFMIEQQAKRASGVVGCPIEQIQIKDHRCDIMTCTRTVICKGKTYYCTENYFNTGFPTCAEAK